MRNRLICVFVLIFFTATSFALSPPQYSLQRKVAHTIGANPNVTVSEVIEEGDLYVIEISCGARDVAEGLAVILETNYDFGGIKVEIRILGPNGNPVTVDPSQQSGEPGELAKEYFQKALKGNRYFVKIPEGGGGPMMPFLFIEMRAAVIQFWNDNIGDLYGNENYVAAHLFSDVCKETVLESVAVAFSTEQIPEDASVGYFTQIR